MRRILALATLASAALLASSCSSEPSTPTELMAPQAWPDEVIDTYTKEHVIDGETHTMTIEIFREGTGAVAELYDRVSVHYTGWVRNTDRTFDSSVERGTPYGVTLGTTPVIAGWTVGLQGMATGTKARLHIPWQMGYGAKGRAPIPGKADLVFDVEIVELR